MHSSRASRLSRTASKARLDSEVAKAATMREISSGVKEVKSEVLAQSRRLLKAEIRAQGSPKQSAEKYGASIMVGACAWLMERHACTLAAHSQT